LPEDFPKIEADLAAKAKVEAKQEAAEDAAVGEEDQSI
jgi:hypothetical protein